MWDIDLIALTEGFFFIMSYSNVINTYLSRAQEFAVSDKHAFEVCCGVDTALMKSEWNAKTLWNERVTEDEKVEFTDILTRARYTTPLILDGTYRFLEDHLPAELINHKIWKLSEHYVVRMTHAQQCGPGESFLAMLYSHSILYNSGTCPGDYGHFVKEMKRNVEVKSHTSQMFLQSQYFGYRDRGVHDFISLKFRGDGKKPSTHTHTMYRGFPIDRLFDEQYSYVVETADGKKHIKLRD